MRTTLAPGCSALGRIEQAECLSARLRARTDTVRARFQTSITLALAQIPVLYQPLALQKQISERTAAVTSIAAQQAAPFSSEATFSSLLHVCSNEGGSAPTAVNTRSTARPLCRQPDPNCSQLRSGASRNRPASDTQPRNRPRRDGPGAPVPHSERPDPPSV